MTTADDTQVSHPASKSLGCKSQMDSADLLKRAVQVVVDNFNQHRKASKSPALTPAGVSMLWFTQGIIGFKAIYCSPDAKGILWAITYNRHRREFLLEVFNKMKNATIPVALEG